MLRNPKVECYNFYYTEVRVLAHADDIAFVCVDKRSIDNVFTLSKKACDATGTLLIR